LLVEEIDISGLPWRPWESSTGVLTIAFSPLPVEEKAIPRGQIHTRFETGLLAKFRFPVPTNVIFFIIEILEIAEVPEVLRESRLDRLDRWPAQVEYFHTWVLAFSLCPSRKT